MLWKCCTQFVSKFGNSAVATRLEKVSFHFNLKERHCKRMFKLLHNYTHLTCCDSWGRKESDLTERLNWTELKINSATVSTVSSSLCYEVMGLDAMILVFWMLSSQLTFSLSSFTFIKRLSSFSLLSAIRVCHLCIWGYWYFSPQSWFQLALHPAQCFSWCTLHIG